jgi:hypothetical protein
LSDPQRSAPGAKEYEIHEDVHLCLVKKETLENKEKRPRADCSMTAANSSSGIEEVTPVT